MKGCAICKSTKQVFKWINGWKMYDCQMCGLLQIIESTKKNIFVINRDVYSESYVSSYTSRKVELSKRFRKYLDLIEKYKNGGMMLDIGCGLGFFVEVARESRVSWDAYGVELNTFLAGEANKTLKGRIKVGSLSHIPFSDNLFDCITCFDVLEHDVDINKNLHSIREALKDDGLVVIQSPNYRSLMQYITGSMWDWWALPDHVLHFSPDALRIAIVNNGFVVRMIKTYEPLGDFIGNIRQVARKNILTKMIFVICLPMLFIIRFIAHKLGYGGLVFVVAQKK